MIILLFSVLCFVYPTPNFDCLVQEITCNPISRHFPRKVFVEKDGNILVVGTSDCLLGGKPKAVIYRFTSEGRFVIGRTFYHSKGTEGFNVIEAHGGYVVTGATLGYPLHLQNDILIMKLYHNLTVHWTLVIGNPDYYDGHDSTFKNQPPIVLDNGDILYHGFTYEWNPRYKCVIIRISEEGKILKFITYGKLSNGKEGCSNAVKQKAPKTGYALFGVTDFLGATNNYEVYAVMMNENDTVVRKKMYDGPLRIGGLGNAGPTDDGGFFFTHRVDTKSGFYFTKVTDEFAVEFTTKIDVDEGSPELLKLFETLPTSDGGYIGTGNYDYNNVGSGTEVFLVKLNASGHSEWITTYRGGSEDIGHSVAERDDGYLGLAETNDHKTWMISFLPKNGEGCKWKKSLNRTVGASPITSVDDINLQFTYWNISDSHFPFNYTYDFVLTVSDLDISSVTYVRDECKSINNHPIYEGTFCNVSRCPFYYSYGKLCSGHGYCEENHVCSCVDTWFGPFCNRSQCFGIFSNQSYVCGGHGICLELNNCSCVLNYTHPKTGNADCSDWKCFGFFHNESSSCSGHGSCVAPNNCSCSTNYSGHDCMNFTCFGIHRNDHQVCEKNGVCVGYNKCKCPSSQYLQPDCPHTCFNVSYRMKSACNGKGNCIKLDKCNCMSGYFDSSPNQPCDSWKCFGVHKDITTSVCSGRGNCESAGKCFCADGYLGLDCETWSCGFDYKSSDACNGNGNCKSPNECDCNTGFKGDLCETNTLYLIVMTPILGTSALAFSIFLAAVFIAICLCMCVCCLTVALCGFCCVVCVCFLLSSVCCLCGAYGVQGLRTKKFYKLKNFDLLLREQELEEDTSIARFKFRKELFLVDYKDIRTISVLGEGGSMSIVFKVKWKGKICAFKCFKTRLLMTNKENFKEFEKEVELLSSLAHPNIIRFYGACINPPRVGILMELCSKGEILDFLIDFREANMEIRYPIYEVLRLLLEISCAFEFIHSKSVIHRDLKPGNVLITEKESAKLMDFGLSRFVNRMSIAKTQRIGTSLYMAPELVSGGIYDEKVDVFSFAILVFVLLTEDNKAYGEVDYQIEFKVAHDPEFRPDLERVEKNIPIDFHWIKHLISKCWSSDPSERYAFGEIAKILEEKGKINETEEREELENKQSVVIRKEHGTSEMFRKGGSATPREKLESIIRELREEVANQREEIELLRKENRGLREKQEGSSESEGSGEEGTSSSGEEDESDS